MLTYYLSDATAHFVLEGSHDGTFAYVVVNNNSLDREVLDHYTILVRIMSKWCKLLTD